MDERSWEDLDPDCLSNVFGRVEMESFLLDVPRVCKKWYRAALNPLCWRHLVFPNYLFQSTLLATDEDGYRSDANGLIKFIGKRSQRSITSLVLPCDLTEEEHLCLAEQSPALKYLVLPGTLRFLIPEIIRNWKNLEILRLTDMYKIGEILSQIGLHCNNFVGLRFGASSIYNDAAQDFVNSVPKNIKYLCIRETRIQREGLVMILQSCRELIHFDVETCNGFEVDDEILRIASHISTFIYKGGPRPKLCSDKYIHYLYAVYDDDSLSSVVDLEGDDDDDNDDWNNNEFSDYEYDVRFGQCGADYDDEWDELDNAEI